MSGKFRIQRYKESVTVLNGAATISGASPNLNGIVRSLTVIHPAALTSATFVLQLLGVDGEVLYDSGNITFGANAKTVLLKDANNNNLAIPVAADGSAPVVKITTAGNEGANRIFTVIAYVERG